jgi:DNA-binding FadR family transcriptional regulator
MQVMSGALPRTSLPDQVFHRLVSDVLAGRYVPGERLPTQRARSTSRWCAR